MMLMSLVRNIANIEGSCQLKLCGNPTIFMSENVLNQNMNNFLQLLFKIILLIFRFTSINNVINLANISVATLQPQYE